MVTLLGHFTLPFGRSTCASFEKPFIFHSQIPHRLQTLAAPTQYYNIVEKPYTSTLWSVKGPPTRSSSFIVCEFHLQTFSISAIQQFPDVQVKFDFQKYMCANDASRVPHIQ